MTRQIYINFDANIFVEYFNFDNLFNFSSWLPSLSNPNSVSAYISQQNDMRFVAHRLKTTCGFSTILPKQKLLHLKAFASSNWPK